MDVILDGQLDNDIKREAISSKNSENVKQGTKPDTRSELYTDDRDSMGVEQAVDTDTKGFGGEPIEDNIDDGKNCSSCFWHKTGSFDYPCNSCIDFDMYEQL